MNRSYLVPETLELVRLILARRRDAFLLVLSNQSAAYEEVLRGAGVPNAQVLVTSAPHEDMPDWLRLVDWGMLLLQSSSVAKQASMPTKLAEFFASGVRPVQFGCNDEVGEWVRRLDAGIALKDINSKSLEVAAQTIADSKRDEESSARVRLGSAAHFSLSSGIERYDRLLRKVYLEK
jgi:hypothetical protein